MMGIVMGFLSKPLNMVMIAGLAVLIGAGGLLYWQNSSLRAARDELLVKNALLETALATEKVNSRFKDLAIMSLEELQRKMAAQQAAENQLQTEIDNATDEEDGAVSPVLDRALRGIGRVRNN